MSSADGETFSVRRRQNGDVAVVNDYLTKEQLCFAIEVKIVHLCGLRWLHMGLRYSSSLRKIPGIDFDIVVEDSEELIRSSKHAPKAVEGPTPKASRFPIARRAMIPAEALQGELHVNEKNKTVPASTMGPVLDDKE